MSHCELNDLSSSSKHTKFIQSIEYRVTSSVTRKTQNCKAEGNTLNPVHRPPKGTPTIESPLPSHVTTIIFMQSGSASLRLVAVCKAVRDT